MRVIFAILLLIATLAPALLNEYGFKEDFGHMFRGAIRSPLFPGNIMLEGRPFYALGLWIFYQFASGVESLAWLRGAGVFGIILFMLSLVAICRKSGRSMDTAIPFAVLACLTPPFAVIASWASLFNLPYAAMAGLWGGYFAYRGRLVIGATLLLISLLTYQPGAPAFFIALFLFIYKTPKKQLVTATTVFIVVSALYAVCLHYYQQNSYLDFPSRYTKLGRSGPAFTELLSRIPWFVSGPLTDSLSLTFLLPAPFLAIAVAASIILSARSPFVLAFPPAFFAAGFLALDLLGDFRLQYILSAGIAIMLMTAAERFITPRISFALLFLLLLAAMGKNQEIRDYFIAPSKAEMERMRVLASRAALERNGKEACVALVPLDSHFGPLRRHEFGAPTISLHGAALGLFHYSLWESGLAPYPQPVSWVKAPPDCTPGDNRYYTVQLW